jgi:ornithine cyclodeaminase/alanine dehydrogenase
MDTLLLTGDDYTSLVSMDDCIAAVERAFRDHGEGTLGAGMLSVHAPRGAFHMKSALLPRYFAAKLNANFPDNAPLPTIQGVLVLFDATNGVPLAVMDSIELTRQRTAAATAVAAKYLARRDSSTIAIYGCGQQAGPQLEALSRVLPLKRGTVMDADHDRAMAFAETMSRRLGIELSAGSERADVVVTCTTSRRPFLRREHVRPGTFIAAVGADNPEKSEIDPELMRAALVVPDVLEQCVQIGDLRTAIAAKAMTRDDVHAELGAIVAGREKGRLGAEEIVVFDSTGAGFQDAAAASIAYERAIERNRGTRVSFQ